MSFAKVKTKLQAIQKITSHDKHRSLSKSQLIENNNSVFQNAINKLANFLSEEEKLKFNEMLNENKLNEEETLSCVEILRDKLNSIVEELKEEENLVYKQQEENIGLKIKLSDEIRKQENAVLNGKLEVIKLTEEQKNELNRRNFEIKEKEVLTKEFEYVTKEIDNFKFLFQKFSEKSKEDSEIDLQSLTNDFDSKEIAFEKLKQEYETLNNENKSISNQINEKMMINENLEEKIKKISKNISEREKRNQNLNNDKNISEHKVAIQKAAKLLKKLEDLEVIQKKFEKEIQLKNQQMEMLRIKNQNLEARKLRLETLEQNYIFETEMNQNLLFEKQKLQEQFEGLFDERKNEISKNGEINGKDQNLFDINQIERNLEHSFFQNDENIQNLEKNVGCLEEKKKGLTLFFEKIETENFALKNQLKELQEKILNIKEQRKDIADKYELLGSEMKNLKDTEEFKKIADESGKKHVDIKDSPIFLKKGSTSGLFSSSGKKEIRLI